MWASPEDSCSYFEGAAAQAGAALLCPRGNRPKTQGGAWGGALADKRRSLDLAVEASGASRGGTLLGFSSGAAFASELAIAEPGRWTGLVLMSMNLEIKASAWKAAGVERVVFAAGELDGTYPALVAAAKTCTAAGLPARFVTLGKVGHHFATDMESRMVDAVTWVRGK
jgi:predicted esterase